MYSANDVNGTTNQIQAMVSDLLNKSGAAAAVAVSNVNVRAGDNTAYASTYGTGGWYGDLLAYPVDIVTGNVTTNTPQWSAQTQLEATAPGSRYIATYRPDTQAGVPFEWANLSATMQAQLSTIASAPSLTNGQETLNFLRGSRTPQEADGYRVRTFILGDIVDSEPVSVRGAISNYPDAGYSVFSGTIASRKAIVYQGANDGMMHAFDASNGNELWAYVPSLVFPNLSELASPNYQHHFYVDGTPAVGDVDFGNAGGSTGSPSWRTMLVGGLRLGGQGFYALDITDPTAGGETVVAGKVLWEFPAATTPAAYSVNVGYSFGKPLIVKTAAYGWVVVVTSGYNNPVGDFRGHLFFLNPVNGQVLVDLPTPAGFGSSANPVNLAQISGFVPNPAMGLIIDSIYGGDNLGDVWRFDVSDTNPANWAVHRLATLTDAVGNPQPVTSAPELTTINSVTPNKRVVLIGTGRLLGSSDITSSNVQSMYALVDDRSASPTIASPRTQLTQKTLTIGAGGIRNINSDTVDWTNSKGWYFDFPTGERVTGDPVVAYGSLVFTTNLPSPVACSSGSYLYAVNVATGGQLPSSNFAPGETAWTGKYVAQSLATRPVVVVLPSGQINSLIRAGDGSIVSDRLPLAWNRQVRKAGWKEILR
jgi:type IV pilus assembly protein PilY1